MMVPLVLQDRLVQQGLQDHRVENQVQQDHKVQQVLQVYKEIQAQQAKRVHRG